MKSVTFTQQSLFKFSQFTFGQDWFKNYPLPAPDAGLKRIEIDGHLYIFEKTLVEDDGPFIVINLTGSQAIFGENRANTPIFDRLIAASRSVFTSSVVIPTTWRQYHEGSLFSIYATSLAKSQSCRLNFEMRPNGTRDLYVFAYTEEVLNFSDIPKAIETYKAARSHVEEAILTEPARSEAASPAGVIVLSTKLPQGFTQGSSLEHWYSSKLTGEQRAFVDKPYDGPVRLRGAAGTGKTLSLIIKFLKDAQKFEGNKEKKRLCFLTHSHASVDLVTSIAESLDATGIAIGNSQHCKVEVRTLYDIAHNHLKFALDNLEPLSLDGMEGRRLQLELIESVIRDMWNNGVIRVQYGSISDDLLEKWHACGKSPPTTSVDFAPQAITREVMNEFASILDAEGIRSNEEPGERYAVGSEKRPSWLMALPQEIDRRFILEIHRRYRVQLGQMNTLSVDQMIGDFNAFLNYNTWDRIRNRDGYDALFIDELHLFTSIERQTLSKLMKRNMQGDGKPTRPPIFMAYDLKQSPRDSFTQYSEPEGSLFSASSGLQNSDLIKLEKVFRYTPQIAEFLADLDAAFPAIDVGGEWEAYSGKTTLPNGKPPEILVHRNDQTLFKHVFERAHSAARKAEIGGRRVAVLCASEEMFDLYYRTTARQFEGKFVPIIDRQNTGELRHAGKRFIFSMPEYVAGLQFHTVFLIHVDSAEAPRDSGVGVRRRFISSVYLGASRAESVLTIHASLTRGGASDILEMARERGSLAEVPAP